MIADIFTLQNPWRSGKKYLKQLKPRTILASLLDNIANPKIIGLIGSRQVGKSSLIYLVIDNLLASGKAAAQDIFYFNLDDLKLHELFRNVAEFVQFVGQAPARKYIFVDEVQRLASPGLFLKEVYDLNLNLKIFYSGSSQLEIKSKLKENLVGRARQLEIKGLSFSEYLEFAAPVTRKSALEQMLVFGGYPGIAIEQSLAEKRLSLKDIYQSYVEKDLTDFLKIDKLDAFNRLVGLLANQIGALLNIDSLAKSARITRVEAEHFLAVLEQTFVIKRISPFFENYAKEITKTPKLYFMDLGLRNYALNSFGDLALRTDRGKLFENFYFLELLKADIYGVNKINFWRTTNQTEIDFIVTSESGREAIEVKWDSAANPKSFATINRYYPQMATKVVNKALFE